MKKILVLCAMLFALQLPFLLVAQDPSTDVIDFTANLSETFLVSVPDGDAQIATFDGADDYNNGVIEDAGISSGRSTVTVEATGDWHLLISAPDFSDGSQTILINNLGVWVDATGTHQFGTEVACSYIDAATALGLQNDDALLIDLGPGPDGNAGTALDNTFILHWEMGTTNGSMNTLTMFEQMSAGDFGPGNYTTQVTLTLNPGAF